MAKKQREVSTRDALGISNRLKEFARNRGVTFEALMNQLGVPRSTYVGWAAKKKPKVPQVPYLLQLVRERNLDLNWLLLGEGSDVRTKPAQTARGHVLTAVEAELRATEAASADEHQKEQAFAHLATYRTEEHGFDAVFHLAVEGVRPLYQAILGTIYEHEERTQFLRQWWANYLKLEVAGGRMTEADAKDNLDEFMKNAARRWPVQAPRLEVRPLVVVPKP